jgi:hypothetical protein
MTASKSLPARPSLESLRKQAKKLARDIAAGDAGDAQREQWFTRGACAALLIDAGAVVMPAVAEELLRSRARGLLDLFERKGLLPRTLKFRAALGDRDGVRAALDENGNDLKTVHEAFVAACHFGHEDVATFLLDRSIALDPELGRHIDEHTDRVSFIKAFATSGFTQVVELGLWKAFVMEQLRRTLQGGDVTAFVSGLQREPWLLGDAHVAFQAGFIEDASFQQDRGAFIGALLDLDPSCTTWSSCRTATSR